MAYTTINDPSEYFNTVLYTGNGNDDRPVIGTGFQPDWLWIKERSSTSSHRIFDSSRGASKRLDSNTQSAEGTDTTQQKSFDSNGFTVGTSGSTNATGDTYVAWQWKANGGTTASNTDGNLTTTVQANQTAGFSIVLWTSTGSSDNIGHGLGATPKVIIEKSRSAGSTDWTYFTSAGGRKLLFLNNGNAVTTSFSGVANVGSSLFTDGNSGTDTRVAWCFAEKQGYSKFGIYTGNGNADGPFIYLGFKPAWVLFKNLTAGHDWRILDNKRNTSNSNNTDLRPNTNDADSSGSDMDFLSNGIKMRDTDGDLNEDGSEHFYMAFAESPFVTSNKTPNNAR